MEVKYYERGNTFRSSNIRISEEVQGAYIHALN
jgi:hypothetical protein